MLQRLPSPLMSGAAGINFFLMRSKLIAGRKDYLTTSLSSERDLNRFFIFQLKLSFEWAIPGLRGSRAKNARYKRKIMM